MNDFDDEIMEEAVELIAAAASLLGWKIAIHECTKNKEFINGIIIGHEKYLDAALSAFDAAEKSEKK